MHSVVGDTSVNVNDHISYRFWITIYLENNPLFIMIYLFTYY